MVAVPAVSPYGKLVGKMSKQKNLTIYETRVDGAQEFKYSFESALRTPFQLV